MLAHPTLTALIIVSAADGWARAFPADQGPPQDPAEIAATSFPPEHRQRLQAWFATVGPRRPDESFGELVSRSGAAQIGQPYRAASRRLSRERLAIRLDSFVCVSYLQYALSLASCIWLDDQTSDCFEREVLGWRYRDDVVAYDNRMHYFSDWLLTHARRGRLALIAEDLGGKTIRRKFSYISSQPQRFPALQLEENRATIAREEARLSQVDFIYLARRQIRGIEPHLRSGDLFAVVGDKPGLLVRHAGLIHRDLDGQSRVLHSSRARRGVTLESVGLNGYILRRRDRRGVLIARPLAPRVPTPARDQPAPKSNDPHNL